MNKKLYRQGDVLVVPVDKIPEKLAPRGVATLALGEVTGHHHTISENVVGYAKDEKQVLCDYIEVKDEGAVLTHQEHADIALEAGNYMSVRQTEYSPEALRNVAD